MSVNCSCSPKTGDCPSLCPRGCEACDTHGDPVRLARELRDELAGIRARIKLWKTRAMWVRDNPSAPLDMVSPTVLTILDLIDPTGGTCCPQAKRARDAVPEGQSWECPVHFIGT